MSIVRIRLFSCLTVAIVLLFFASAADAKVLLPGQSLSAQITKPNTVYEIKDVYDLKGKSLTIPEGCTLSFDGGAIRNGILVGNKTIVLNPKEKAIFINTFFDGSWNVNNGSPEWFGAVGDGKTDDRKAVQAAMDMCSTVILKNNYLIYNAPFNYSNYKHIPDDELTYYKDVLAQKNRCPDEQLTPLRLSSNKTLVISGTMKAYSPLGNLIELRGDNSVIKGGGTILGCGIVNTVNVYSGKPGYAVTDWEAALIYIKGSYNRVENLTIKDPSRQGVSIDDYLSKGNEISNCIFGGGLKSHTDDIETCSFSCHFGIYARGNNTVVRDNVFKKLDGKGLYDALYCNYTTTNVPDVEKRTEVHTVFENNVVEDALEHAVYTYASNLRITGNTLRSDHTVLQLFNGKQYVDNNILHCNEGSLGIYVSGERQVVTNNKIYNVGRYGIRCAGYYNGSCDNDYVAGNYIEKLMFPFSDSQPQTSPAISFESTSFRNNSLHINKITCENNTVVCIGESKAARTIPIVGIIAIYGDANTTFDQINITNNTVLNSNVADNIGITLMNPVRSGVALVEGNKCINDCSIISTTPGEATLMIQGIKRAIVRKNHLEQLRNTGTAFELTNVDKVELSDNKITANMNSQSVFYYMGSKDIALEMDGSNVINGQPTEQIITIPAKNTATTAVNFSLPTNRWELDITPLNRAARKAERNNPLKIIKSDKNGVQLGHMTASKRATKYKVRVIYK